MRRRWEDREKLRRERPRRKKWDPPRKASREGEEREDFFLEKQTLEKDSGHPNVNTGRQKFIVEIAGPGDLLTANTPSFGKDHGRSDNNLAGKVQTSADS